MTRKDYEKLAQIIGKAFNAAPDDATRTFVYDEIYTPIVAMLKEENPEFDQTRFSYYCATVEHSS